MKVSLESVMKASLESVMATDQAPATEVPTWPSPEVGWPVAGEHRELVQVSGSGVVRVLEAGLPEPEVRHPLHVPPSIGLSILYLVCFPSGW